MFIDLHCHSRYSEDGVSSPRHIAEIAKKKGIVVALTDHNLATGWRAYESACKSIGIDFILGQEQKVFSGKEFAGELLFYFLNEEIKSNQVPEAIDEARSQGALISIAHPFDSFRKMPNGSFLGIEKIVSKIDAIEVFNARCISENPNQLAKEFAESHSLGITAGSDAHLPREIGSAFVEARTDSLEGARKMIKSGKVTVHGKLSGKLVHLGSTFARNGWIKKETD